MASNTDYLPDEITYGFVADRVLLAVGDTNSDDDRYPDGVPAQGTVRFSPQRTILYTQQHPATVLPQDIECTIYHRDHPVALENGYEPELVGKLVDPAGHVGNVALIVGWYDVVYRLSTGTAQRFRFQVKPEHTNDDPLWLPEVAPLQPTPSERFVVNEQVYNDTKEARDEAVDAAQEATAARDLVLPARDQTLAARDETLQHGITVDTSVGTRVFVGDTMIYGDTGWRELTVGFLATGRLRIRRIGNLVYMKLGEGNFSHLTLTSASAPAEQVIPTGFRPSGQEFAPVRFNRTKQIAGTISIQYNGWADPRMADEYTDISDTLQAGSTVWVTNQSWPSSLPGSPA